MNIAGAKTKNENVNKKEVFLDKKLRPITECGSPNIISTICFFYEGEDEKLVKISFISDDEKLPNFTVDKKIIDRYLTLRRADDKTMEALRKSSLETKSLVTLKKFAFECAKYAA